MSKPIRVLIVEDEFLTSDLIKDGLEEMGYTISGMARDAKEACSILDKKNTDFVMLDINIQGQKDGIWIANRINELYKIPYLFLTAFSDKNTIETALNTKPYGYLVKPFNKIDIYTSIEIAIKQFVSRKNTNAISEKITPYLIDDYLFIKDNYLYNKVLIRDILYAKSDLKYIEIHLKNTHYVMRQSLLDIMQVLPNTHFIQTHRSYIINKYAVDQIGPNYLKVNNQKIPISLTRKEKSIK